VPAFEYHDPRYRDREDAGRILASKLLDYRNSNAVVLAIPNGGVPVAAVIAEQLNAELYLMIVRKLQIPGNPEAGFGAVTSDGFLLLNQPMIRHLGLMEADIIKQKEKALKSIRSRQKYFGKRAELPSLNDHTAIIVDDGLASGFTMEAAVKSANSKGAERIIIAVPTSSLTAYRRLESHVDKIICPDLSRLRIFAVADAYQNWYDLDEEEVLNILENLSKECQKKNRSSSALRPMRTGFYVN
jgi:putative phosphoribosyl transferase